MGSLASTTAATAGAKITSFNPANGTPLGEVPELTAPEVRAAVEAAQVGWYPYKEGTFKAMLAGAKLLFGKRPWQR